MRVIKTDYSLNDSTDHVKTEYTIFKQLKYSSIPNYILVDIDLARLLNLSTPQTQAVIDKLTEKKNKNYMFVCQHIRVGDVNWYGNKVFTPHSTVYDDFISIPHYLVNTRERDGRKRNKLFSFTGWKKTHAVRYNIITEFPKSAKDTGSWGVDGYTDDKYLDELEETEFALCPRGTGVSSIRLFEAMSMGCIPVILANGYQPPLHDILNWDSFAVFIDERDFKDIPKILGRFTENEKRLMCNKVLEVSKEYFSNETLSHTVKKHLAYNENIHIILPSVERSL